MIPAYQPDEKLIDLCSDLRESADMDAVPVIIIVDDGSGEGYADIFSRAAGMDAVLLRHEKNRGKGAAIKTGLSYIKNDLNGYSVVTADADGQHSVEDIKRIALSIEKHPNTLVLGVRDFSKMPPRSKTGNAITRFFFKLETGLSVSDTQTGLRGFSYEMLDKLTQLDGERYEYEMNMLLRLEDMGFEYLEIPIETIYIENNASSHFHALRDGYMVFSRVLKYAAVSVLSAAVDFLLYWVLLHWLNVRSSYVIARILSALFNFECNRRTVFKARFTSKNLVGYAALCIVCMFAGSYFVGLLHGIGMNELLSKLIVDSVLFIANYNIQKYVIFRKKA